MNIQRLIFVAILLPMMINGCKNQHESSASKFQGMWRLDKFESLDSLTGKWGIATSRIGYSGYILYDGHGHMAVHLMPAGYHDFDATKNIDSLNNEDLKKLANFYSSNYVYFANYEVQDSTVKHHKLSATNPADWGTTVTRNFEFRGDTLILTPQEKIGGVTLRLRWIKL